MLYAHWEGFVKEASTYYVEYVARKNLKYSQLASNFLTLAVKRELHDAQETYNAEIFTSFTEFFRTGLEAQCSINWSDSIQTQSNLSSTVFKNIICILGLDYSPYETKQRLIDETLLDSRNKIAHGQYTMIDIRQYEELNREIINLMDLFKNQIENAAITKAFLFTTS